MVIGSRIGSMGMGSVMGSMGMGFVMDALGMGSIMGSMGMGSIMGSLGETDCEFSSVVGNVEFWVSKLMTKFGRIEECESDVVSWKVKMVSLKTTPLLTKIVFSSRSYNM